MRETQSGYRRRATHTSFATGRTYSSRGTVSDVQRRVVMLCIAVALACVDLADKALTHAAYQHARSPFIVVAGPSVGVAFNLADVFIFVGDATMVSAVLVYALRNRAVLRASV